MAKWHRREQERWKKRRARQRAERGTPTQVITITKDGRTAVGPRTDHAVTARYIEAHDHLPKGVEAWSEQQIRKVAASVQRDEPVSWERALIVIAHHQSRLACELIKALWAEAPPELHGFCEQAYAEALMWIGESYTGEAPGEVLFDAQAGGGGAN